jgi:Ca2+/Na+ antiporter
MVVCFASAFVSESDLGLSSTFGTDSLNILLIYGVIVIRVLPATSTSEVELKLDHWVFLRDTTFYLVQLGIIQVFLYLRIFNWWAGLVIISLYLVYVYVQRKTTELKKKIYELAKQDDEEDYYEGNEEQRMIKRRDSSSNLLEEGFINHDDEILRKKLMRIDAVLAI